MDFALARNLLCGIIMFQEVNSIKHFTSLVNLLAFLSLFLDKKNIANPSNFVGFVCCLLLTCQVDLVSQI